MMLALGKRHFSHEPVPYVLRSYRRYRSLADAATERYPNGGNDYPIHQVRMSTSAAPFHFKAVNLRTEAPNLEKIDGRLRPITLHRKPTGKLA